MKGKVRFINKDKTQFFATVKKRVDEYFSENKISKHADTRMVLKTIAMLTLYFVPYFLILSGNFSSWQMLLFCFVMGFGVVGIGTSVMHDANHGAYSSNGFINNIVGHTVNLIGGNVFNWKFQHNVLHHTYTNIHEMDDDIEDKIVMRFSPHSDLRSFHRYQHIYVFFFYSIMTLYWALFKDFVQFFKYISNGVNKNPRSKNIQEFILLVLLKAIYFTFILVIPHFVLGLPFWQLILGFLVMHFTAGLALSVIFQLAHVVEHSTFPIPDNLGNIENEWAVHQMYNTANFAKRNVILSWFIGGLNYQIEHHLFPQVCHIHYKKLSAIVKDTAEEFEIPYIENHSFGSAFMSHIKTLRKLGRGEPVSMLAHH